MPITVNRRKFFDSVRLRVFSNHLDQGQVDGCNLLIDEFELRNREGMKDTRWLAYILATAFHETQTLMQPIKEHGGDSYLFKMYDIEGNRPKTALSLGNTAPGDGVRYCGRGLAQITGKTNYEKFSILHDIDYVGNPDLVLVPEHAVRIIFDGMIGGIFTGRKLQDYFNNKFDDWINARRIINILDRAEHIASIGQKFFDAITH